MSARTVPGAADVVRLGDDRRNIAAAEGHFGALIRAYAEHAERWEVDLDGLTYTMMRQGLAATALHLCFRPRGESVGFTLNFSAPPVNLFLNGEVDLSTVTGRAFTRDVRATGVNRFFAQTMRTGGGPTESRVEFRGLDVLEAFEEYYRQSVQTPARFFEPEPDRFLMLFGLPGVDRKWMERLAPEDAAEWLAESHRRHEARRFRFFCGCTRKRMLTAVRSMFADRPGELFLGEPGVETSCPRCGTRWWIQREEFEA